MQHRNKLFESARSVNTTYKFKYVKIGYWISALHDSKAKHYAFIFKTNFPVLKASTKVLYQLSEQISLFISILLSD